MEPPQASGDGDELQIQIPPNTLYEEKWNFLRPLLEQLYLEKNWGLARIRAYLQVTYGFHALGPQYKYHFKKWNLRKNLSIAKKDKMLHIHQTRAEAGKSTDFQHQGRMVEHQKLRRHLKEVMRRENLPNRIMDSREEMRLLSGSAFQMTYSIFLNWNMPYGTFRLLQSRDSINSPSSFLSVSTPSDVVYSTPPANNALSPIDAPSPLTKAQQMSEAVSRAHMFVQGRHGALVKSMRTEEKELMSKWLYQFWLYGFKTAKHWGHGPRDWTAELLKFNPSQVASPLPTPGSHEQELLARSIGKRPLTHPHTPHSTTTQGIPEPSALCRWSIHYVPEIEFEPLPSPEPSPEPEQDPFNETTWKDWPITWKDPPFQEKLLHNLATNDFSNIESHSLPIAVPQIANALADSDEKTFEEAIGFSIMARNLDLVRRYMQNLSYTESIKYSTQCGYSLIQLAIAYLDGSKVCCNVLTDVLLGLNVRPTGVNHLNHTILDSIMLNILKAHTALSPGDVDDGLRDERRFPGEEVDVCGRWDADSGCIQALLASGNPRIPFAWKHKFCNTSIQTICHCVQIIFDHNVNIEEPRSIFTIPSGLFVKRCVSCGLKMQCLPLHTLVLVAVGLAQHGTGEEDLFGVLAVLLCMLQLGADPLVTASVSMSALFNEEGIYESSTSSCDHEELRPAELADSIYLRFADSWSNDVAMGWRLISHVLQWSELEWRTSDLPAECSARGPGNYFGTNKNLAILWGAVQAEFLTYRRREDGDPWLSPNFDMRVLLESLEREDGPRIGFVDKDLMKPICDCGLFRNARDELIPRAEETTHQYCSNLDDWSRTTFIAPPHRAARHYVRSTDDLEEI